MKKVCKNCKWWGRMKRFGFGASSTGYCEKMKCACGGTYRCESWEVKDDRRTKS